jgi:hypothetical protein
MSKVVEEMQKLRDMLDEKNIPWQDDTDDFSTERFENWICRTHFEYNGNEISVINGIGTYGGWGGANLTEENLGLLEIMIGEVNPIGWMKAEECMELLETKEPKRVVELALLSAVRSYRDKNINAILLESYIQANGPLSNDIGDKIKKHIESLGEETKGKQKI